MKHIDDVIKGLLESQKKEKEDLYDTSLLPDDQAQIVSILDEVINIRKKK